MLAVGPVNPNFVRPFGKQTTGKVKIRSGIFAFLLLSVHTHTPTLLWLSVSASARAEAWYLCLSFRLASAGIRLLVSAPTA